MLLHTGFALGQNTPDKVIRGSVIAPNEDVTGIAVQNHTAQVATITDFKGDFSITASIGDTLVFSAVQFKRKIVPITQVIFNSSFIQIPLEKFVNELDEVTVQPFGLSGTIEKDLTELQLEQDVSAEALGLPNAEVKIITQSERKLFEADHGKMLYLGLGFGMNINKILNRISGRTKRLKKHVEVDTQYAQTLRIQESIEDSLLLRELQIPKQKIADFMYFCEVDQEFQHLAAANDQLLLWEYLMRKSKLYRKENGLE